MDGLEEYTQLYFMVSIVFFEEAQTVSYFTKG